MRYQSLVLTLLTFLPYPRAQQYFSSGPHGGLAREGSNLLVVSWIRTPWQLLVGHSTTQALPPHIIAGILEEVQTCVCPPSLTRDSYKVTGQMVSGPDQWSRNSHCTLLRCQTRKQETRYLARMGKRVSPTPRRAKCKTRILYQQGETGWKDIGCILGTTSEYSLLPRTHKTQKPSVGWGLCQSCYQPYWLQRLAPTPASTFCRV